MKYIGINQKQWKFLEDYRNVRELHLYGSAGSSKTYSICQHILLERMLKEKDIIYTIMKYTLPACRVSVIPLIEGMLKDYGISYKQTGNQIIINGNVLQFMGFKAQSQEEEERIKGLETNYLFYNEAMSLTRKEYLQLCIRPRRKNRNGKNQLIYDYNPSDEQSFLKGITDKGNTNTCKVGLFTYKDNAFLPEDNRIRIEQYQNEDKTYWNIYGLGLWDTPENIIYRQGLNWDIVNDEQWIECRDIEYGLDFGFNAPAALVEMGFSDLLPKDCPEHDKKKKHIYERELIYQTHLDDNQLIELMKEKIPVEHRHRRIIADSEDPGAISTIHKAGFNIFKAIKEKGSVVSGIKKVKTYKIHHHIKSIHTIEESQKYKWKEDKNGDPIDEPAKAFNHTKDGERYPIHFRDSGPTGELHVATAGGNSSQNDEDDD